MIDVHEAAGRLTIVRHPLNGKLRRFSSSVSIPGVTVLEKLQRLGGSARPALVAIAYFLPIALIIHAVTFWGRGVVDLEGTEFIQNYLLKRPFFAQIFDPQVNDWGPFQARELSHVFDLIDARFFAWLLDRHLLLFVPLSGALGLIALSAIYFWGARKVVGLSSVSACMLLSLFLSCIVVQASTAILYRSSKIILSVLLVTFLFYLWSLFKTDRRNGPVWKSAALFLLGFLMSICDPQGFYYLISATLVVALLWLIAKAREQSAERAHFRIMAANAAAVAAAIFYDRSFAPWLIHRLNGYWPDFSLQIFRMSDLLDPMLSGKALEMLCEQISFLFGNIPFLVLSLIAILAGAVIFWKGRRAIKPHHLIPVVVSLIAIVAIFGLLLAMIARHPAFYRVPDHHLWYYTLTIQAAFLFGLSVWPMFFDPEQRAQFAPLAYIAIGSLVVLNVLGYNRQRALMIQSMQYFGIQYENTQNVIAQFKSDPPQRDKLRTRSSDLLVDDPEHFLENVEISYLHLIGGDQTQPASQP